MLWVDHKDMNMTIEDIDGLISTEIPDPNINPELYKAVYEYMVHGPCEAHNPRSPSMHHGEKCSKK